MIGKGLRQIAAIAVLMVGLSAGSIAAYCEAVVWSGNFHTLEEGQVYRSAQLDSNELAQVIAAHDIKSILNLRGSNPGQTWYRDELAIAEERGVTHYDLALSARRRVPPEVMRKLVEIMRTAPKPLLIHCKSGSDRTGLAAALYRCAIEG